MGIEIFEVCPVLRKASAILWDSCTLVCVLKGSDSYCLIMLWKESLHYINRLLILFVSFFFV